MHSKEYNLAEWEHEQSDYIKGVLKFRSGHLILSYLLVILPLVIIISTFIILSVTDLGSMIILILIYAVSPVLIGIALFALFISIALKLLKGVFIITRLTSNGIYQYARYKHRWQSYIVYAPKHIFVPWNELKTFQGFPELRSVHLSYKRKFTLKDRLPHIITGKNNFKEVVRILSQHVQLNE